MRKRVMIGAGLVAAVLAAGTAAFLVTRHRSGASGQAVVAFREARAFAVSGLLQQVDGPYSLLLGDSQVERLFLPNLCGRPAINAAIAGTRISGLRAVAGWIALPRPPETVVVTIGTNDLTRRQRSGGSDATGHFRDEARALFAELVPRARRVVATAIPPLDADRPGVTRFYDAAAAPTYSAILAEECARAGCHYVDAFADLRDPAGLGRSPDGVHLGLDPAAGRAIAARIEAAACSDGAGSSR